MTCAACSGPLELLGVLGNRKHFRCRNCGMDSSKAVVPPPATIFNPTDESCIYDVMDAVHRATTDKALQEMIRLIKRDLNRRRNERKLKSKE